MCNGNEQKRNKKMTKIRIIKLKEELTDINYSREGDAGIDLRASGIWVIDLDGDQKEIEQEEYEIKPMERIMIKTGVKIALEKGHWGSLRDRSGLSGKHGLHTLSGVLDETYRGEINVVMINLGAKSYKLIKNEKIAQLIIMPYAKVEIEYVKELEETNRDLNGFGSSGKF